LDVTERRQPAERGDGRPEEGEPRQLLVVAVRVRGVDPPTPCRGDVARDARESEPVDAERDRAEGKRHEPRGERHANEGGQDRSVGLQPRRIASSDCGDWTAAVSRIASTGRVAIAARRSTKPEIIEIATIARTTNANVATLNEINTSWPKMTKLAFGCSHFSARKPSPAPTSARRRAGPVTWGLAPNPRRNVRSAVGSDVRIRIE